MSILYVSAGGWRLAAVGLSRIVQSLPSIVAWTVFVNAEFPTVKTAGSSFYTLLFVIFYSKERMLLFNKTKNLTAFENDRLVIG
ncbi:MAG: hypothetical protein LBS77_01370 [Desulfovibrio sp.]|jgi:hypothetical protein|nr:hypothetical protein [Desulfovibrio sp.]